MRPSRIWLEYTSKKICGDSQERLICKRLTLIGTVENRQSLGTEERASTSYGADLSSIREAQTRISEYAHVTPVFTCQTLDEIAGRKLYFKCETFQKGGAFKFRGACNAVFSLSDTVAAQGVVTHSSGNHAGALALAAKLRGVAAYIVVPENTPKCKVDAIATYGAQITKCHPTMEAREEECARIKAETNANFIPPYNDSRIISGQVRNSTQMLLRS